MTDRPDEVVAEVVDALGLGVFIPQWLEGMPDNPYPPGTKFVLESALQLARDELSRKGEALDAANARLAEQKLFCDGLVYRIDEERKRLADVLALADRLEFHARQQRGRGYDECNPLVYFSEDHAKAIRRAAAGEGDANQGDGG